MSTEDDTEQYCDGSSMAHRCTEPAGTIFSCCRSEVFSSLLSCRFAKHSAVRIVESRIIVSASIFSTIVDVAYELASTALECRKSCCRDAAYRNLVVELSLNRPRTNHFVVESAYGLDHHIPLFSPTPLIVPLGTIEFGRLASRILVMILRIKLATSMVILDQIAAKSEFLV